MTELEKKAFPIRYTQEWLDSVKYDLNNPRHVEAMKNEIESMVQYISDAQAELEKHKSAYIHLDADHNIALNAMRNGFKHPEDSKKYWTAHCNNCNWWGSSELLNGGGVIADTGDYSDVSCPVCGGIDSIGDYEDPLTKKDKEIEKLNGQIKLMCSTYPKISELINQNPEKDENQS